jgi:hypothetical protein
MKLWICPDIYGTSGLDSQEDSGENREYGNPG